MSSTAHASSRSVNLGKALLLISNVPSFSQQATGNSIRLSTRLAVQPTDTAWKCHGTHHMAETDGLFLIFTSILFPCAYSNTLLPFSCRLSLRDIAWLQSVALIPMTVLLPMASGVAFSLSTSWGTVCRITSLAEHSLTKSHTLGVRCMCSKNFGLDNHTRFLVISTHYQVLEMLAWACPSKPPVWSWQLKARSTLVLKVVED